MSRDTGLIERGASTMETHPILPEARQRAMKASGLWPGRTLLDDFDRWVATSPDRVAIVDHNSMTGASTSLTYASLSQKVDRIAAGLARLGVGRSDVVSMQLPNWWQFVALHLAALRLGAITNPVMPIFREREMSFMLHSAEAKVLVIPREYRGFRYEPMARAIRPDLPALEHVLVIGGEGGNAFEALLNEDDPPRNRFAASRPAPDDVIEILYTSGTTGEPKGVMHTSNTLYSNVLPYAARMRLDRDDIILMASPLAHQTGFMYGIVMPIALGGRVVFQDIWNAEKAVGLIAEQQATFTMAATPFLSDMTDEAARRPAAVRSLRTFLSAGAPIPRALVRRAAEHLGANIISAWGMTENGAVTTTRIGDPPDKTFETDGCPMDGMEIRVVDEQGARLPANAEGRLQTRGPSNFVGYLKHPEWYATDADGWFETGDLARIDGDGYVRITGRTKDVIIRGGENIPVVEIEGLIYQHPAIQEVALVAMPDPRLGERACAFAVLREDATLTFPELIEFLEQRRVARNYLPERLEVVEAMPKTPSGKIQKVVLRGIAKTFTTAEP
jgi:cyclohexanecarboxylate-CoA ligase